MDPNATLQLIIDAALEGDSATLLDSARDLAEWLDKGGAAPTRNEIAREALRRDWAIG